MDSQSTTYHHDGVIVTITFLAIISDKAIIDVRESHRKGRTELDLAFKQTHLWQFNVERWLLLTFDGLMVRIEDSRYQTSKTLRLLTGRIF